MQVTMYHVVDSIYCFKIIKTITYIKFKKSVKYKKGCSLDLTVDEFTQRKFEEKNQWTTHQEPIYNSIYNFSSSLQIVIEIHFSVTILNVFQSPIQTKHSNFIDRNNSLPVLKTR